MNARQTFLTETAPEWTDLGNGWARDERGYTVSTVTVIEDVLAEHCESWDREGRPTRFTRLITRKLLADGGTFIANVDGHLRHNHVVKFGHHSSAYRLVLVGRDETEIAQAVAA